MKYLLSNQYTTPLHLSRVGARTKTLVNQLTVNTGQLQLNLWFETTALRDQPPNETTLAWTLAYISITSSSNERPPII